MSDEEITLSGECVRIVADSFALKAKWRALERQKVTPDISPCMVRTRFKPKFILEKSEGEGGCTGAKKPEFLQVQVFKPPPPPPAPKPPTSAPPSDAAQADTRIPGSPGITTDESAGLITPETRPVDPVVVVSELGEGIKGDVGVGEEPQDKAGPEVVLLPEQQPIDIVA
ncbi:hypothetical protein NLI96_g12947 [Meripilus lineatus]|uniref:Uncharacterized protein n=1 Tax=Meripilus lineatus TaxID=2056292 RepID=A0AAD5UP73_9APHY|nr:hypothetical protein NLI96_g12947 [Physisporinus lineatus]